MKKIFVVICIVTLSWVGNATATPFQIDSTDYNILSGFGGAAYNFTSNSSGVNELAVGESFEFDFGTFNYPLALATGQIEFTVNFSTPEVGNSSDTGSFEVASFLFASYRTLEFGAPVTAGYSYNGYTGGLLSLDLYDIDGIQWGTSDTIRGKITNIADATNPVPEPSTILLMGMGLAGLVGCKRKKSNKKA